MATRVARNVVPHEMQTAIQAQYARRSCLGDESDAGFNRRTIQRKAAEGRDQGFAAGGGGGLKSGGGGGG